MLLGRGGLGWGSWAEDLGKGGKLRALKAAGGGVGGSKTSDGVEEPWHREK